MYTYKEQENTISDQIVKKKEPNQTGIPDVIKERFEENSGFSFDDVRVHYNSEKPYQLQALAYTQGNRVYIAPGQERHLEHEMAHIIQQKQGRVQPTVNLNGLPVNDDQSLEREADNGIMQYKTNSVRSMDNSIKNNVYQRCTIVNATLESVLTEGFNGYKDLFKKSRQEILEIAGEYIIETSDGIKGYRAGYEGEDAVTLTKNGFRELGAGKSNRYGGHDVFWGNAVYFISDQADMDSLNDGIDYVKTAQQSGMSSPQEVLAQDYAKSNPKLYGIDFNKTGYFGFDLTKLLSDIAQKYIDKITETTKPEKETLISNQNFLDISGPHIGIPLGKSSLDVLYDKGFFLHGIGGTDCAFSDSVFDSDVKPHYESLTKKTINYKFK